MHIWIEPILSLAVATVSLFVIVLRPEDEAARQWAVGALAFILGHYLKGTEEQLPR